MGDSAEKDKNVIKRNSKDKAKLPVESSPEHDNGTKSKNKVKPKPNSRRVVEDHGNMIEESSPEVIKLKSKAAKKVPNPFKKPSLVENDNNETEPVNVGEILKKISVKPKTVKQRLQNAEAMKEYNENHEDDIFGEQPSSKSSKISLKASKTTLLNDPDSDSDQDISVHSARTPVTAYFGPSSRRDLENDRTPGFLSQPDSPSVLPSNGFQRQAFIQRNLAERNKGDAERKRKKKAFASTLTAVVSRSNMDRMADQSTKMIGRMTQKAAGRGPEDDYFEEEDQEEEGRRNSASTEYLSNFLGR